MSDAGGQFELKKISPEAIGEAIDKAEHYRLLNDPEQAESICLDVLEVDPDNQKNLIVLILSITDQFASSGAHVSKKQLREYLSRVTDNYERIYYAGIIAEREARAYLTRGHASMFAFDSFREAMDAYEKAAALRSSGNDEALLRYNSCVRTIEREHLHPIDDEPEQPLE